MSFYIICPSNTIQEKEQKKLRTVEAELKSIANVQETIASTVKEQTKLEAEQYAKVTKANDTMKKGKTYEEKAVAMTEMVMAQENLDKLTQSIEDAMSKDQSFNEKKMNLMAQQSSIKETMKQNKASDFEVQLPQQIVLTGEWKVALVQMTYPMSWRNIDEQGSPLPQNCIEVVLKNGKTVYYGVPHGYYASGRHLSETIGTATSIMYQDDGEWMFRVGVDDDDRRDVYDITYNEFYNKIALIIKDTVQSFRLGSHLQYMMGFKMDTETFGPGTYHATYTPDLHGGLENLFVYCNLVEPVVVGNVRAPLLRTLGVSGKHGDIIDSVFQPPHYIPVAQKAFGSIRISINTDQDQPVRFQFGKVIAKLHFVRK